MSTVPMPAAELTVGRQGHYAGALSRLVAFAADVGALWGIYLLGTALVNGAVKLVTGHSYALTNHQILSIVVLVLWGFLYFSYQWAVSGRTVGMAILGLQVVNVQGGPITLRQAVLRTVGLGLCFVTLGIGFLGIVYQRERRALDDFVARTAVVYDWDARAARLRWLARKEGAHQGLSRQRSLVPKESPVPKAPEEPVADKESVAAKESNWPSSGEQPLG